MKTLFRLPSPRVCAIPPGAGFLKSVSRTLIAETRLQHDPEALADIVIYVPTRRAARNLALELHRASGQATCLLPDIRPLGELDDETLFLSDDPAMACMLATHPGAIAPAIESSARTGALIRLVMAYHEANDIAIPPVSALIAARELARLLDQAAVSGDVDWEKLTSMVKDSELARHWQNSVQFLNIITHQWPAFLDDNGQVDPHARHHAVARAIIDQWQRNPPQTPVIIAGSTGAIPATRLLMQAIANLPQGIVILPGPDREASDTRWSTIANTPSHPQFSLARSLKALKLKPDRIADWPDSTPQPPARLARRRVIHEALAPADNTADWHDRLQALAGGMQPADFMKTALSGLSLIETRDDRDETMIAALTMRAALQTPGKTAALVTPGAGIARHVSALLRQWDIFVEPSCGLPLAQVDAGSFVLLVADWLTNPTHPVKFLAMLKHRFSRFDRAKTDAFDKAMRGPYTWRDWSGLLQHLKEKKADTTVAATCHLAFQATGLPSSPDVPVSGADWLAAIHAACDRLGSGPAIWTGEGGAAATTLLADQDALTEPLGPQPPDVLNAILYEECRTRTVVSDHDDHPRLAIWGPLEARLQTADQIILAGLNEGVWPAQPPPDGFVPRAFRARIGLSDPDERIGLAAHDFAQLASAPDVMLLTSRRRDDQPAIASRWIWRLRMLARAALGKAAEAGLAPSARDDPRPWLAALRRVPALPAGFSAEPCPRPPVQARPTRLSVSRVEQLIRDPYAVYCRHILGLYPLDRLDMPPDARMTGTAIHKALEIFEAQGTRSPPETLLDLIEKMLEQAGEKRANLIALHDRRLEAVRKFVDWRNQPDRGVQGPALVETRGTMVLKIAGRNFTLEGTADRIEKRADGKIAILDFKTGKPPSEKQVRAGLAPQMPLQGLIAQKGGYDIPGGMTGVATLTYIQIGTRFGVQEIGAETRDVQALPPEQIIAQAHQGLIRLLTEFCDPSRSYLSAPIPERVNHESDYARLARRDEWANLASRDQHSA